MKNYFTCFFNLSFNYNFKKHESFFWKLYHNLGPKDIRQSLDHLNTNILLLNVWHCELNHTNLSKSPLIDLKPFQIIQQIYLQTRKLNTSLLFKISVFTNKKLVEISAGKITYNFKLHTNNFSWMIISSTILSRYRKLKWA